MLIHYIEENWKRLRNIIGIVMASVAAFSVASALANGAEVVGKLTSISDRRDESARIVTAAALHGRATEEMLMELQKADLQFRREVPVLAAELVAVAVDVKSELEGGIVKARVKSAR